MGDEPPMFSALDDAFERAELPTLGCSNPTLGSGARGRTDTAAGLWRRPSEAR